MKCIYCGHPESKVLDSRESSGGVRRRRKCLKCKKRFTTYEKAVKKDLFIIKKDNTREKFDRKKLERGIDRAFEKRPVSKEKIEKVVDEIEETLRKKGKREIKSSFIGNLVSKKIKSLDKVAYIRFASVYRDFEDTKDFKEVIRDI